MNGKTVSGIILILLLIGVWALAFSIQPVKAAETIYIRADGSIHPPTAPISTADNITYTFTDDVYDTIVMERDNIVVDGAGYTVQGTGSGMGIYLPGRINVTIKNMEVKAFDYGIQLHESSNNIICGNNITANDRMGITFTLSSNNSVCGNKITANNWDGAFLEYSSNNNIISGNNITNNDDGICLDDSSYNIICGNNITNTDVGIDLFPSSNNSIYHNNFINNSRQVLIRGGVNLWDDGYPCGGNYWSDYTDEDLCCGPNQDIRGSDGVWDHPYVIDAYHKDDYPLVKPYAEGNLSISIYMDKYNYHAGDTMHLRLNVRNPDSVKYLCFAIWCELPGGSIYAYMHEHSVVLPIGLYYANPLFKTITLPSLLPGKYTWHVAFLERATHTIIVEDTTEWEFA